MPEIIKKHLPPSCYSRRKLMSIDGIVIHFVSAKNILPDDPFNLDAIIGIFEQYKVSAHYLIRRDGTIIELVPLSYRAHHAGKSIMNDREGCNNFTVGIELEGGTDYPYTDEQMASLGTLSAQLMTEHQFSFDWVQGHDKVRKNWNTKYPQNKRSVKVDPGEHFEWQELGVMLHGVSESIRGIQNESSE